jgi:multidrug efflux system membrane fusion protein
MRREQAVLSVVVVGAIAAGCGRSETAKVTARPVRVEEVRPAADASTLRYSASIQPFEQVPVAFKGSGYVRALGQRTADGFSRSIQQGDEIRRGAVLARVDDADARQRLDQARASAAEAAASLERLRVDAGRAQRLFDARSLTRADNDAAQSSLAMAQARHDGARAQVAAAELALADCALVAPLDGVVLARKVEVGTLASPGLVGYTVADLARVKAVFGVPDRLIAQARIGMQLQVTSDAFGDTPFAGVISSVSPSADPQSRVFSVEVTIANPGRQLKAGMIATVAVPESAVRGGGDLPTVPLSAIVKARPDGGYAVFVAEGPDGSTVARAREVTLGEISGNRIGVRGGITRGERVVVTGASLLRNGEPVRVIPGTEES